MKSLYQNALIFLLLALSGCECGAKWSRELPVVVTHDFCFGHENWAVTDGGLIIEQGATYLQLLKRPSKTEGGSVSKIVSLNGIPAKRMKVELIARSSKSTSKVAIGLACQTGTQDGPTYGVLLSEDRDFEVSHHWSLCSFDIEVPKGSKEVQIYICIAGQEDGVKLEESIEIRSVRYFFE